MKRASLSALPVSPAAEPADLTDRLLGPEAPKAKASPPAAAEAAVPASASAAPPQPTPEPAAHPAAPATAGALEAALQQAAAAADALRQASREAPARYDVALRYRLDALAHHLRQVAEFMASAARR